MMKTPPCFWVVVPQPVSDVNKCIDAMNSMIRKYNTLDRLVLSMAVRNHEGNEAQVCLYHPHILIITLITRLLDTFIY